MVELIPLFEDNYLFVLVDSSRGYCVALDPGDSEPLLNYLDKHQLQLKGVLITHHHHDHIDGLSDLKKHWRGPIFAPLSERQRIREATEWVRQGDRLRLVDFDFEVLEMPGHTLGHVAYHCPRHHWLFSGDVLFGLGCGRLFEGSHEQMFTSLQKIKALPEETLIYCSHEYTERNLQFCKALQDLPDGPLQIPFENLEHYAETLEAVRSKGYPSVPLRLSEELKVNPFLLAETVSQFRELRMLRDQQ